MNLTTLIQEALLCLLCFDDHNNGGKLVAGLLPASSYDPYFKDIAASALSYREKFRKAPGEHTLDLVKRLTEQQPDREDIYERLYHSMLSTKGGLNRKYVIAQALLFSRYQNLRRGITKGLELLKDADEARIDEAEAVLSAAAKTSNQLFDPGTFLHDHKRGMAFLNEESEPMLTGIKELDKYGLGPRRGTMWMYLAKYKSGKSWCCTHLGKMALRQRFKTLHVTLEMDEPEVAMRYYQSIFSMSKRQGTVLRRAFRSDELGRYLAIEEESIKGRPHFQQENIRAVLKRDIEGLKRRSPLVIKRFPTGSLTVRELRGYLSSLESSGFLPDLFIVDYPDLMKVDARFYRHELGQIWRELRGLAGEKNMMLVCPSQSNRAGFDDKLLKGSRAGEDISKVQTADTVITYSQTDDEKRLGLARLHVDAARADKAGFTILIAQAYALGQFCLDSTMMASKYWDDVPKGDDGEEEEDE